MGFEHVIPLGLDHILFITALFFLNSQIKSAVIQCSLFTLAHSITLALVAMGYVQANTRIVESIIAISIFFVALENVFESKIKSWRLVLVFCFGLIHGMGFASSLKEIGVPQNEFIEALLGFNIGVEVAQVAIIVACYLCIAKWLLHKNWYNQVLVRGVSILIAGIGLFWSIERFIAY